MKQRKFQVQKELKRLDKQEKSFQARRMKKKDSKMNQFLDDKVPEKLQHTLEKAFVKAFQLIFQKGTGVIEKTFNPEELEKEFQVNSYAHSVHQNKKSLRVFSKKAKSSGTLNLLVSGGAGVGLGILGIGIPDIALFTGLMLKSIYEIALNYGYDYNKEEERKFILLLIRGAVSRKEEFSKIDNQINELIEKENGENLPDIKQLIEETATALSDQLLYMKFLQGIPLVGIVGGAYDAVCMKQVTSYVELKYRRRFYGKIL
ncbi:MAG: EcsC family protein [Anaerostipes sp.]|nr:EcsC family protein [Anaerostipes sp.]MDD3746705.1 EcsC family protein [Anaerostipes sp.]